jgi:hypothetical protein
LKIVKPSRNQPSESSTFKPVPSFVRLAMITNDPSESQKPPYVAKAVAPKTFLFRNSHMPARSCAIPP